MKMALCDDSREFRLHLNELCEQFFCKENISVEIDNFSSGQALLESTSCYDLILLDMDMPEMTGTEVGSVLRERSQNAEIIYITSFAEYAIEGYRVQAFSYLLKNDLEKTFNVCMASVIAKIKAKKRSCFFKFVEGQMLLSLNDLVYIESQATRLIFHVYHLGDERISNYHLYGKIDDIQKDIAEFGFIRTNQSYLINSAYIKKVKCYYTELTNGEILSIPKVRYRHVKEQYAFYKGDLL